MSKAEISSEYILTGKTTLDWYDIRKLGRSDNAKRWYPYDRCAKYFVGYRTPSRNWPNSYLRAALTQKFARWLIQNDPELAIDFGLIERSVPVPSQQDAPANEPKGDALKSMNP